MQKFKKDAKSINFLYVKLRQKLILNIQETKKNKLILIYFYKKLNKQNLDSNEFLNSKITLSYQVI